jgi:hypothetical protein
MSVMDIGRPAAPPSTIGDPEFAAHIARAKLHQERAREHLARAERLAEEARRDRERRRHRGYLIVRL